MIKLDYIGIEMHLEFVILEPGEFFRKAITTSEIQDIKVVNDPLS